MFSLVGELESWMKQGKLNHVAPGEPEVNAHDLESFIQPYLGQVTRQTELEPSSVTINEPSRATATPTGRPHTL